MQEITSLKSKAQYGGRPGACTQTEPGITKFHIFAAAGARQRCWFQQPLTLSCLATSNLRESDHSESPTISPPSVPTMSRPNLLNAVDHAVCGRCDSSQNGERNGEHRYNLRRLHKQKNGTRGDEERDRYKRKCDHSENGAEGVRVKRRQSKLPQYDRRRNEELKLSNSAGGCDNHEVRDPASDRRNFGNIEQCSTDSQHESSDDDDTQNEERVASDTTTAFEDSVLDWLWPAADTFTDDSVCPRVLSTCSQLGSQRIRLVKIRPGPPNTTMSLAVRTCFLTQAEDFTALSYTWGSSVQPHRIFLDNQPIFVTTNLWRFLNQARRIPSRFSGWLWIDALSVDQSDPWEKFEQVKMISEIFKSAKRALIWLGPAYGDSGKAMKALPKFSPFSSRKSSRALWAPPLGPAILGLSERAYWQRLWVLQELRASRALDMMCGSHCVDLEHLISFLLADNFDQRVQANVQILRNSLAAQMFRLIGQSSDTSLRSMLDVTGHLRCADARDKVYAILNVVSVGRQNIEPDYTVTLIEVLNKILRNMYETELLCKKRMDSRDCSLVRIEDVLKDVDGQSRLLEKLFHLRPYSIYGFSATPHGFECFYTPQLHRELCCPLSQSTIRDVRKWCKQHDHQGFGRLVRRYLVKQNHGLYANFRKWPWIAYCINRGVRKLTRLFDEFER
jgi:hypothetical protein